jgi:hypothetical protein
MLEENKKFDLKDVLAELERLSEKSNKPFYVVMDEYHVLIEMHSRANPNQQSEYITLKALKDLNKSYLGGNK